LVFDGTTFKADVAAVFNDSGADVDFRIESDTDANAFFLDGANGNVGIGTSSPNARLTSSVGGNFDVTDDDYSGDGLNIVCTAANAGNNVYAGGISFSNVIGGSKHAGIAAVQTGDDNNQIGLAFFSKSTTVSTSDLAERARITSGGDFCLAATSAIFPSTNRGNLTIGGSASSILFLGTATDNGAYVFYESPNMEVWNTANGYTRFGTNATERARITSGGNFGIGTSSPTTTLTVNGLLTGGLGAQTTGGVTDWNDITNAVAGMGYTLLVGTDSNGPGSGVYFHVLNFEYNAKDGSGNMTQIAIPYNGTTFYSRYRFGGAWSSWTTGL